MFSELFRQPRSGSGGLSLMGIMVVVTGLLATVTAGADQPKESQCGVSNIKSWVDPLNCSVYFRCFRVNDVWKMVKLTCPYELTWDVRLDSCVVGECNQKEDNENLDVKFLDIFAGSKQEGNEKRQRKIPDPANVKPGPKNVTPWLKNVTPGPKNVTPGPKNVKPGRKRSSSEEINDVGKHYTGSNKHDDNTKVAQSNKTQAIINEFKSNENIRSGITEDDKINENVKIWPKINEDFRTGIIIDENTRTESAVNENIPDATKIDENIRNETEVNENVTTETVIDKNVTTETIIGKKVPTGTSIDENFRSGTVINENFISGTVINENFRSGALVDESVKNQTEPDKLEGRKMPGNHTKIGHNHKNRKNSNHTKGHQKHSKQEGSDNKSKIDTTTARNDESDPIPGKLISVITDTGNVNAKGSYKSNYKKVDENESVRDSQTQTEKIMKGKNDMRKDPNGQYDEEGRNEGVVSNEMNFNKSDFEGDEDGDIHGHDGEQASGSGKYKKERSTSARLDSGKSKGAGKFYKPNYISRNAHGKTADGTRNSGRNGFVFVKTRTADTEDDGSFNADDQGYQDSKDKSFNKADQEPSDMSYNFNKAGQDSSDINYNVNKADQETSDINYNFNNADQEPSDISYNFNKGSANVDLNGNNNGVSNVNDGDEDMLEKITVTLSYANQDNQGSGDTSFNKDDGDDEGNKDIIYDFTRDTRFKNGAAEGNNNDQVTTPTNIQNADVDDNGNIERSWNTRKAAEEKVTREDDNNTKDTSGENVDYQKAYKESLKTVTIKSDDEEEKSETETENDASTLNLETKDRQGDDVSVLAKDEYQDNKSSSTSDMNDNSNNNNNNNTLDGEVEVNINNDTTSDANVNDGADAERKYNLVANARNFQQDIWNTQNAEKSKDNNEDDQVTNYMNFHKEDDEGEENKNIEDSTVANHQNEMDDLDKKDQVTKSENKIQNSTEDSKGNSGQRLNTTNAIKVNVNVEMYKMSNETSEKNVTFQSDSQDSGSTNITITIKNDNATGTSDSSNSTFIKVSTKYGKDDPVPPTVPEDVLDIELDEKDKDQKRRDSDDDDEDENDSETNVKRSNLSYNDFNYNDSKDIEVTEDPNS